VAFLPEVFLVQLNVKVVFTLLGFFEFVREDV